MAPGNFNTNLIDVLKPPGMDPLNTTDMNNDEPIHTALDPLKGLTSQHEGDQEP